MMGYGHMKGEGMRQMEGAGMMHGEGHGHRQMGSMSSMDVIEPTQRDDGGAASESLGGLNMTGMSFVAAPVMQPAPGAAVVPYSNHLRSMQFAPAGGYGGMGFIM